MEDARPVSPDVWCDLLCSLPRHHYPLWGQWLPDDGLLTFWEEERCGERLVHADPCEGISVTARLAEHYGPPDRISGSRLRSQLRRNVGAALIRARHLDEAELERWMGPEEHALGEVEALTTKWLRSHVGYRVVEWSDVAMRRRWAVGMLSGRVCRSQNLPPRWLGRKAHDQRIAVSGVWVPLDEAQPGLTSEELDALAQAVEASLGLTA